jgi:Fe-S oxidoreductase/nitrate reductase gamma subunit
MEPLSEATREILWNISHVWVLYAIFAAAMVVFGFGVYQRIQFWRKGKSDDERFSELPRRLLFTLREVFAQSAVRQKRFPGLIHVFVLYSFLVLVVTTTVVAVDHDFGTSLFKGAIYVVLSIGAEFAGLLILLGLLVALWRRHVKRPVTLEAPLADTWAFLLLLGVIVTGFVVEALRIAVAGDAWARLSFAGAAISPLFSGLDADTGTTIHSGAWWIHAVLSFLWMATIPYTKFVHLLTLPANAFFSKMKPAGELARVDLEAAVESEDFDEESFTIGIDTTSDLTWKQRLDGDACVECGRCDEVCPAIAAGQPLSPKKLIVNVRDLTRQNDGRGDLPEGSDAIVGNAFDENFVWYCLTCMACVQACPAFISHVDTFVEIRRNEVSMKGRADGDVSRTIRSMEAQGNPFGTQIARGNWVKSLNVPVLEEGGECDVLYWVGCLTTFDEEKQQIATDLISVLRQCGIDVALLGKGETCCGDPARVCGDENLFQSTAKNQVAALNKRKFKKLLVSCPHCYNALKNEYVQFGGRFDVVHHSQFLRDLIEAGKLKTGAPVEGRVVYHDPCYLGRYQKIYDPPRQVLRATSGSQLVEMERSRERSFCCGGGGGHFWMETREGERINTIRIQQVRDAGARLVVTSCPYCLHMLRDATKTMNLEKEIKVVDLVSRVAGHGSSVG